jgi:hypothetical protein
MQSLLVFALFQSFKIIRLKNIRDIKELSYTVRKGEIQSNDFMTSE